MTKRTSRPILDKRIGRFLERLGEAVGGESVRGFARRCGISEASLRDYLRGDSFPSVDRLALIADASKRDISWFLSEDGPQAINEQGEIYITEEKESLDTVALAAAIATVERTHQAADPETKARTAAEIYRVLKKF